MLNRVEPESMLGDEVEDDAPTPIAEERVACDHRHKDAAARPVTPRSPATPIRSATRRTTSLEPPGPQSPLLGPRRLPPRPPWDRRPLVGQAAPATSKPRADQRNHAKCTPPHSRGPTALKRSVCHPEGIDPSNQLAASPRR